MSLKPARGTLFVYHNELALAEAAAKFFCDCGAAKAGPFIVALSGGSTPKLTYETLATEAFIARCPWARTQVVFGDERFVPHDDKESNARMADEAMLAHVPVPLDHVHRVPTVDVTPDEGAAQYEALLRKLHEADTLTPDRPLIDLNLLGLGEDGHTASLIPGEPVLVERQRWVAAVGHGRPEVRITLTYPALESAANTVFLVQGEGKRAMLDRLLSGDDTIPAGRLNPQGSLFYMVDKAAAGRWIEASSPS